MTGTNERATNKEDRVDQIESSVERWTAEVAKMSKKKNLLVS